MRVSLRKRRGERTRKEKGETREAQGVRPHNNKIDAMSSTMREMGEIRSSMAGLTVGRGEILYTMRPISNYERKSPSSNRRMQATE